MSSDDTLYEILQNIYNVDIKAIEGSGKKLRPFGFRVEIKAPSANELFEKLTSDPDFKNNRVVQRIREHEPFSKIADELYSERSALLGLSPRSRRKYNRKVQDLAEIIPSAQAFEAYSFVSPKHPVGAGLLAALVGTTTAALYSPEIRDSYAYLYAAFAAFFMAGAGASFALSQYAARPMKLVKDEIKYVSDKLGI